MALREEDEVIVLPKFVGDCGEQSTVAQDHVVRADLDFNLDEGPVWPLDERINCIVVNGRQVNVKSLLQCEANDPVTRCACRSLRSGGKMCSWRLTPMS